MRWSLRKLARTVVPNAVRTSGPYRRLRTRMRDQELIFAYDVDDVKLAREADYWMHRFEAEGGTLRPNSYERLFLAIAGELDRGFIQDRIVADFGCGPRGSLLWAKEARARIGIDVLSSFYARLGIQAHDMVYVTSSESWIPLPDNYVEVMFTLNAMDHCHDFEAMAAEMARVMAPGGRLVGSFNLHEPPSVCEPQTLTQVRVESAFRPWLRIDRARAGLRADGPVPYRKMLDGEATPPGPEEIGFLWMTATKRERVG